MGIVKPLPPRLQRGHPLARGLVGAWELSEGSGLTAYDSSGYGGHGTLIGGPTWVGGRAGSALHFDGNASRYVDVPHNSLFSPPNLTVALWVNPIVAAFMVPIKTWASSLGWFLEITPAAKLNFGSNIGTHQIASNGILPLGIWTHVAATYDGTTVILYINGRLDRAAAEPDGISDSNVDLIFGRWTSSSESMNGSLDDIRIYNRVLSAAEIALMCQMTGP